MTPGFLMSSSPISKANVNELFKTLPKPIADLLTSMPAGEQGEDIRVKFMHSAVYYRDFAERYHIGKAALQAEAVKKAEANNTDEMSNKKHKADVKWATSVEASLKILMPVISVDINIRFNVLVVGRVAVLQAPGLPETSID